MGSKLIENQLWVGILLLIIFGLFYKLGSWGVIDSSEARYAEIGMEMLQSGDLLHPRYMGIEHYHKPPVTYYITALSYRLFGVHPFAARFPLQIAIILQLWLVYRLALLLLQKLELARIAVFIYASFLIVWISSRNLTTDAFLNTFVLASAYAVFNYIFKKRVGYLYLFAVLAAAGFLTKITAYFIFVGPIILGIYWIYKDQWKWSWHMITSFLLFAGLASSWFVLLELEGIPIFRYQFYEQSLVRYTTDTFHRNAPFYLYLLIAVFLSFPWLLVTLEALLRKSVRSNEQRSFYYLLLFWFVLPILIFSLSKSKLTLYILPSFPILAIAGAQCAMLLEGKVIRRWMWILTIFTAVILTGFLAFRLFDSSYILSGLFYLFTAMGLIVIGVIKFWSRIKPLPKLLMTGVVFAVVISINSAEILSKNEVQISTAKPVVKWLKDHQLAENEIYIYNDLLPSLAFHLKRPLPMIANQNEREIHLGSQEHVNRYYFDVKQPQELARLTDRLNNHPSVVVLKNKRKEQLPAAIRELFDQEQEVAKYTVLWNSQ